MTDLPPVRCDDESTWRHKGEKIGLTRLLELIEENGGSGGLDLHGADLSGLDAGPEVLRFRLADYRSRQRASDWPPWLASRAWGVLSINLSGAHLEDAHIRLAHLQNASLAGARLENADLYSAHAENACLYGAHLENADLGGAHLQNAALSGAHLENAELVETHLQNADLGGASLGGALWYGCYLDRTRVRRDSLGQTIGDELKAHKEKTPEAYGCASEAYLVLKNNFNSIGRYEDASWAYVKEQQMEKMAYYREWRSCGRQIWSAWGPLRRWLRNWLYELATGYGERPWNPLIIGAVSILAFAFGYVASGAVAGFTDALIYSLATFATFNLARPEVQPQGTGMEMASSLEALLGIGILALFVFTLGNRMRRS